KPVKHKVRMAHGKFNDQPQDFYFPHGHPRAGVFKGMANILEERGFGSMAGVLAQCKDFKCMPDKPRCCCRRMLYEQPDFANVPSLLEQMCKKRGYDVLFLPKFHPELNPIEMCWGRAKYWYRRNPSSSKDEDLERNMLSALDSVTQAEIRRYSRRCRRFLDAYHVGLSGKQAAWASKKYRGHRVLPKTLMGDLEDAGMH
ncbi:hypothetical protein FA15DRAFT_742089, partial [Coprinopsis marcescibilis]